VFILGIVAAAWGVLMAVSPVLQIRRMAQRRSSADVSIGYLLILLPGFALWTAYGFGGNDIPLVIPNMVAFCVDAAAIGYAVRLRRAAPLAVRQT
jgi:MtN3 and saliva related transmembrane protein